MVLGNILELESQPWLHPFTVANWLSQQLHTPRHLLCWRKAFSRRCIIPSDRTVPLLLLPCPLPCALSLFHLTQWRSTISTTLIPSQPACQSRQDTTPTGTLSPLITYALSSCFFSSLFFPSALHPSPFPPSPLSVHPFFCGCLISLSCSLSFVPHLSLLSSSAVSLSPFLREESNPSTR